MFSFQGCMQPFANHIRDHLIILGAVGLGISVIPIFGMIISCCLYVKLKDVLDWPLPKKVNNAHSASCRSKGSSKSRVFDKSNDQAMRYRNGKIAKLNAFGITDREHCPVHSTKRRRSSHPHPNDKIISITTISDIFDWKIYTYLD